MMKKRKKSWSFLLVFVAIMVLLSIGVGFRDKARGAIVAAFSSFWEIFSDTKQEQLTYGEREELARLRLENQFMNDEVQRIRHLFLHELYLSNEIQTLKDQNFPINDLVQKIRPHKKELLKIFKLQLENLPANVIFRPSGLWNNTFWINVGIRDNEELGRTVLAKNSPVLIGTAIVGVVDYVGNNQSRVRLITDSTLNPSVRVLRNKEDGPPIYLAKGELRGSGKPLWRSNKALLKGTGFNYDFEDEEGHSRDLVAGGSYKESLGENLNLVEAGDLLVSSGMDGIFPKGLAVATVTKVFPLKEGDYYYELEAVPVVKNLSSISTVFVIPPLGYDPSDFPPST